MSATIILAQGKGLIHVFQMRVICKQIICFRISRTFPIFPKELWVHLKFVHVHLGGALCYNKDT